ncbi:chromosome segregation protein SMC [Salsuginibacillus kocurii]|uniref:chromosome segregation protein SMC n=1 Tax=Salsuginibacillus kocurii TaxID=427078 RepID=UPI00037B601E|nr:chromosome segregation protein SMC [Salsuginibacillus kocurii]
MYLKRMELKGFKSFADHVHIDMTPGVTVIVGPNGSGKSNIADGIRWVLGEQSVKSLRGQRMEDVIFAGSSERKPVNMAEITLILDNEDQFLEMDYSEISLTRKLYRSGESEYFINKSPCRRKDVIEILIDSGLGKEAYSIIGQGQVDEILSSKPADRRRIFEEAAGVLKYKTRKEQAEKKLLDTTDNLNRMNDILHELYDQLEPLKEQASVAKQYLSKKEELKSKEVALLTYDIKEAHRFWEEEKQAIDVLTEKEETLRTKKTELEAEQNKGNETVRELEEAISLEQEKLMKATEKVEQQEGQRALFQERGKHAKERLQELESRQDELEHVFATANEEWQTEQKKLQTKKKEEKETSQLLARLEPDSAFNPDELKDEIERLKSQYIDALNQQAAVRNEIKSASEQLERTNKRLEKLEEENYGNIEERKQVRLEKEELEERIESVSKKLEKENESLKSLEQTLQTARTEKEEAERNQYQAYQHIQDAKSRLKMLEEMEADFRGFHQGAKEVLKAKQSGLSGIHGAVAELIHVSESYETAIETALGGALQHVVVDAEKDGRQAIQYLKTNGKGRATFLPLETVKERSIDADQLNRVKSLKGFVGVAADMVEADASYQPVVRHLLGAIILAETLKDANEIAGILRYRFRIVTLDGDIVNPGGAMSGGSRKQNNNPLLGRQREIKELQTKITKMEAKTLVIEKNTQTAQAYVDEQNNALEEAKLSKETLEHELAELRNERIEIDGRLARLDAKLQLFDREKTALEDDAQDATARQQAAAAEEQRYSKQLEELDRSLKQQEAKQHEVEASQSKNREEIQELKLTLATQREQTRSQEQLVERLTNEKEEHARLLEEVKEELEVLRERLNEVSGGTNHLEEDVVQAKEEKIKLEQVLAEKRKSLHTETSNSTKLAKEIKELQASREQAKEQIHQRQMKINRVEMELDTLLNKLEQEYELSFERANEEYSLQEDPEETREKVNLLKMDINELGAVNLGAIDEYERIKEREEFLSGQQEDLSEAKSGLEQVIYEMDEEMTRRFQETFTQIRTHFKDTFCELFGGGEADLTLTEPDELISTGVEIVARPPGKKKQNLSLLSGGEKALTAIALLFSVLKVKPVPFCVLDEVEAALDEANVARFASYLKRASDKAQFIVVSHRKATMEEGNALYGVTMEESGVSRLVSVQLEESLLYTEQKPHPSAT